MRILLASAFSVGLIASATSAMAACSSMQTAQKDQVIASSSNGKAQQSTPIPARQDRNG